MASIKPIFELTLIGSANTATKDDWYDIGSLSVPSGDSPIASGAQLWLAYLLLGSQDKALIFELRVNNAGQNTGTAASTTRLAYSATDPSSGSVTSDIYQRGDIQTLAPVAMSTGVEKIWLRVQSGTNTVATFNWFLYYTRI
jgi:hypothetical protein